MVLHKLEHTESDLSQQLQQARQALSARTVELDNLKSEWASRTSEITMKHRQDMTEERERALQIQTSNQERYEREKRDLEQNHTKLTKQMDAKLFQLESENKVRMGTMKKKSGKIIQRQKEER